MYVSNRRAQLFSGYLIDGEFTDTQKIWDGPAHLVLPIKWTLEKELPSMDFFWNTPDESPNSLPF
jgi:hypothetical protein